MSPKKPPAKRVSVRTTDEYAAAPAPSMRLYRRIAVGFVVLVLALLVAVVYVSMVEAVIRVTPAAETVKTELLFDVVRVPTRDNEIRGRVLASTLTRTQSYEPAEGSTTEVVGTARGTVTLHNDSNTPQTLVRTTRLLAPDGTLVRLDQQVTVPARGTAQAPVYADQPGAGGDLPPSRFVIPGLNAARQQEVYASSEEAFTGGFSRVAAITQEDIDRGFADLRATLEAEAKQSLRSQAGGGLEGESYAVDVVSQSAGVDVGTQAERFDLTLTLRVVGAFYDRAAVQDLASRSLFQALPPGKRFAEVNAAGMQATVEKVNMQEEQTNVRVYLDGRAVPSSSNAGLDPARFAGMSADQVRRLLIADGLATDVDVSFTPGFIRTVPRLKDHIVVEIVP